MIQCWHIIQRYHSWTTIWYRYIAPFYCPVMLWPKYDHEIGILQPAPYGVVPYWDEAFYRVAISRMKIWRMPTLIMMKLPTQAAQPSKFSWDVNLQNRTLYTNEIEVMHERVFFCQKMKHFQEWRVTVLWRFSQNSVFKPWLPIL